MHATITDLWDQMQDVLDDRKALCQHPQPMAEGSKVKNTLQVVRLGSGSWSSRNRGSVNGEVHLAGKFFRWWLR